MIRGVGRRLPFPRFVPSQGRVATSSSSQIIARCFATQQDSSNDAFHFAPLVLAAGAGLALFTSTASIAAAEANKSSSSDKSGNLKNPPPAQDRGIDNIDWNAVIMHSKHVHDPDDEDDQPPSGEGDDNDADTDIPSYINQVARGDIGNSLNHHAPLGTEAQVLLKAESQYPLLRAELTSAPNVPPPVNRHYPVHLVVDLVSINKKMRVQGSKTFEFWPFSYLDKKVGMLKCAVPGPFIRARVGDILQVNHTNKDESGMAHSVDFHAVCGPGGGAPTTFAEQDETRTGAYRLMKAGLYVYHCASAPIPLHIHNGMFGLILVEPEDGLPPVDKEFYIMQHEMYLLPEDNNPRAKEFECDYDAAARENPSHVLFNGREASLVDRPLVVNQDEKIRIYFGNAGPNLVSSFHIIGTIFDKVYRDGDLISHPASNVQTTLVPAGGATVLDLTLQVPGNFALVDHSINRIDKGAVGFLKVKGTPRPDIYDSAEPPKNCAGCKVHS